MQREEFGELKELKSLQERSVSEKPAKRVSRDVLQEYKQSESKNEIISHLYPRTRNLPGNYPWTSIWDRRVKREIKLYINLANI